MLRDKLRQRRIDLGLSQKKVAEAVIPCGSAPYVYELEFGRRELLDKHIVPWMKVLGFSKKEIKEELVKFFNEKINEILKEY